MKDEPGHELVSQMKEARDLLDEGEVREALVLAMDVLWRELDQLRETLGAFNENLPPVREAAAGFAVELPRLEFVWPKPLWHLMH